MGALRELLCEQRLTTGVETSGGWWRDRGGGWAGTTQPLRPATMDLLLSQKIFSEDMSHSQMLGKFEYGLPAKF